MVATLRFDFAQQPGTELDALAGEVLHRRMADVAHESLVQRLAAARRFAHVTSTDYVPDLLDKCALRARAQGSTSSSR